MLKTFKRKFKPKLKVSELNLFFRIRKVSFIRLVFVFFFVFLMVSQLVRTCQKCESVLLAPNSQKLKFQYKSNVLVKFENVPPLKFFAPRHLSPYSRKFSRDAGKMVTSSPILQILNFFISKVCTFFVLFLSPIKSVVSSPIFV